MLVVAFVLTAVVTVAAALSFLAIINPDTWGWLGLVDWAVGIIVIALAVRLIIRARRRMRGESGART